MDFNNLNIGDLLKLEREKRRLEIESVAKQIKVSANYITAIEENYAQNLLSKVYVIGYTKMYANFLNIPSSLIESKLLDAGIYDSEKINEEVIIEAGKAQLEGNKFDKVTKSLIIASIVMLAIFFELFYLYHNNKFTNLDLKQQILRSAKELNDFTNNSHIIKIGKSFDKEYSRIAQLSQPALMASNNTWVKIYDSTSRLISSQKLKTGDILFIPNEEGIIIDAEHKNAIEYFDNAHFQTLEQRMTHKLSDPFYIKSARFIPYTIE